MDIPIKDNIQQIFMKYDKDMDGLIDGNQFQGATKEVGFDINQYKLGRIFRKLDVDKVNKINLDTFYDWIVAMKSNMAQIFYIRLAVSNVVKKMEPLLSKIQKDKHNQNQGQSTSLHAGISFGDAPDKSQIGFQILFGNDVLQHQQEYEKYVKLANNQPNLVIQIKSNSPAQQLQKMQDVIEQGKVLLEQLLPEQVGSSILSQIKFEFGSNHDTVFIVATYDNSQIQQIIQIYTQELKNYLGDALTGMFRLCFGLNCSGLDIVNQSDKNFIDMASQGFNANLDIQTSTQLMQLVRELFYKRIESIVTKGHITYKFKDIKPLIPLLLIQSMNIQFKLKSMNAVENPILNQMPVKCFTDLLNLCAQNQFQEIKSAIVSFPIYEQLTEALSLSKEGFSLTMQFPQLAVNIFGSGDGFSNVLGKILE